ncbi:predicted protein [Lichtheimia corymbifera JMRC:FSU:9682]|uniref:Uncharacterized protein n=1 Tax=Lichtheimia corymbifera JMRC:FSU:9682 TaxID=1263082 RepID=A0A068RQV9_9FUNG|nr:predicted protein [Lichtheimia corymbifera JMRC:FSU:9682]CDH55756.1 predicted protein [Lichtheimia corymbifera JMRC:FSU:9682]
MSANIIDLDPIHCDLPPNYADLAHASLCAKEGLLSFTARHLHHPFPARLQLPPRPRLLGLDHAALLLALSRYPHR